MWFLLPACAPPSLPDPVIERAVPSFAWNGEPSTIALVGSDFWPSLTVDARRFEASVNPTYTAHLQGPDGGGERVPLLGVGIVDDEQLTATVPAGLAPGIWTLTVESPSGATASLPGGFRITDQRAARLVLDPERFVWTAGEQARIGISLLDVDDRVVEVPFELVVVASGTGGAVTVSPGDLADVRPTPSGDGVRGSLVEGRATVGVTATVPGRVDLVIAAGDPASPVVGDSLTLAFEPGGDLSVAIELPDPGPFVAGEPFVVTARVVDQYGNPVPDPTPVTLRTLCSGWVGSVVLAGDTAVAVTPTLASSAACPEDQVVVVEPAALPGRSDGFQVAPGPASRLEVIAAPASLQAGDLLNVLVLPEDAFGNTAAWGAALSLTDSVGGLVDETCVAVGASRVCTARATRSDPAVVVEALGDDGVRGVSAPIEVLPDDVVTGVALRAPATATAGEVVPVLVSALDAWGNVVPTSWTSGVTALTDERGDVACAAAGGATDGSAAFDCVFTEARLTGTLEAALEGLVALAPIAVRNGPLAQIRVSAPASVEAGEPVAIDLAAGDAWGNPYLAQDDPTVDLWDDGGSLTPTLAPLDAAGEARVVGTFTVAGLTRVRAGQGGVELGRSEPITVASGPTVGLRVRTAVPWAWTNEPAAVSVESVDAWGNRTALDAAATLSSLATSADDLVLPLVNGVGSGLFVWPAAALPDLLDASAAGFEGSAEVIVVRRCPTGPSAAVAFDGHAVGVTCATEEDGGGIAVDLTGSARGSLPIASFAAALPGRQGTLDASGVVPVALPGVGRHEILGLAVDTASCASEVAGAAWSAPDDGGPAGPIALSASVASLPVLGAATLELVGVTDCRRAPAAGSAVLLAATGGALAGVSATGEGLAVVLDVNGDASATLDTSAGGLQDTQLSVVATVPGGGARGELLLPLTGDAIRPVVLDAAPVGSSTERHDTFSFTFSEPLLPGSVTPAAFTLGGVPAASVAVSGAEVTVSAASPLDGAFGPHVLTVGSGVRDLAGNRLAGEWSGRPAPWTSAFGGFTVAPAGPQCGEVIPGTLRFRPDGDDGLDEEADELIIGLSAAAAPAWWVVEVHDDAGERVDADWVVPLAALDAVAWDGRGFDGAVRPPGRYEIAVSADDGLGNRSAACVVSVQLEAR